MAEIILPVATLGFSYGVYRLRLYKEKLDKEINDDMVKKILEKREKDRDREIRKIEIKAKNDFREILYEINFDKSRENDIEYLIEFDNLIKAKMDKYYKISQMWNEKI